MRSRAFTKGRSAFDSDDEYRRALNGEFDGVRGDFPYEAGEDPGDGEDLEDPEDGEAVRAELRRFEESVGGTHFLEVLEKFMKDCSGSGEPPYLPFRPVRNVEHIAVFDAGAEALRLRYGAYGFDVDRLEGDEVVQTWRGLGEVDVLDDWDDALCELAEEAEEAELEREDLEDRLRDEFFDDTLPGVLADRRRGAEFLDFAMDAVEDRLAEKPTQAVMVRETPDGRIWLGWNGDRREFFLRRADVEDRLATWEEEEFLEGLRKVAWDDPDAADFVLGGGSVKDAGEALDDLWYDEVDDGFVVETVDGFLDNVRSSREKGSARARTDAVVTGGTGYGDAGRVDMTLEWSSLVPDAAQLTVHKWSTAVDREEDLLLVPLAFLRWWRFCRERGW